MSKKIDKRFLIELPIVFVEKRYYGSERLYKINKLFFVIFNIFAMFASFAIVTLTTIVISKVLSKKAPEWYFYATTMVTALLAFATSIINFFYIKDNIQKYKKLHQYIQAQIIKHESKTGNYKNSKDPDFLLYHNVAQHMGNKHAREASNE